MDSSNRQENSKMNDETMVQVSERVAMVANLKKVGSDELTPQEWMELINVALVHAKPYFKYVPLFSKIWGVEKIKKFHLARGSTHSNNECIWGEWLDASFQITDEKRDPVLLACCQSSNKLVQILELSDRHDQKKSVKFLMNSEGVFIVAACTRPGPNFNGIPTITTARPISDDYLLEMITAHPQVGPDTLFAISSLLNDTYQQKLSVLDNLGHANKKLAAICANVNICNGHYVMKYPWGYGDGSNKVVEEVRY